MVRMPNCPGADSGNELLSELALVGVISRRRTKSGPYPTTTYRLTNKRSFGEKLSKEALAAISAAAEFVQNKSATELRDLTHEFSRS